MIIGLINFYLMLGISNFKLRTPAHPGSSALEK